MAVARSLGVLGVTAAIQAVIYVATGSVALLADLIHNFGDALTAIPVGTAFLMGSARADRNAALAVIAVIFISACFAGYQAVTRLVDPQPPDHLVALALAGVAGFVGNWIVFGMRARSGRQLHSPALIADGDHARADAYLGLAVVASAIVVALGFDRADPLIGLGITLVVLRVMWESWRRLRRG